MVWTGDGEEEAVDNYERCKWRQKTVEDDDEKNS
jgi:hypothetical protein